MNALVIGKFYTEGFALHIAETLSAMGRTVRRFEPGGATGRLHGKLGHRIDQVRRVLHSSTDSLPSVRAHRLRRLWEVADSGPVDLTIVVHDFLWPREVAELRRRTRAPVVMWFPDSIANFGRAYFMVAPYDLLFFKDPYIVKALSGALESPVLYLPECFNPVRHWGSDTDLGDDPDYRCDVATVGNLHPWRVAIFRHLADHEVKIWGPPGPLWLDAGEVAAMRAGRSVYDQEKARAFRGAKIVVNNLLFSEIWGVNARCFEAAGAGAFQLVDWRPGLPSLFVDEEEIVTFVGVDDLRRKVDYWLSRDAERRAIANAGMRRAHRDHTYAVRLGLLLDTLAGRARGHPVPICDARTSVRHGT